jgi:hypothetical protein
MKSNTQHDKINTGFHTYTVSLCVLGECRLLFVYLVMLCVGFHTYTVSLCVLCECCLLFVYLVMLCAGFHTYTVSLIQHTTWQDKQITNDTHHEHAEIQCKYEIQHTIWQDKQTILTKNTQRYSVSMKSNTQHDKYCLFILSCCVLDFILTLYLCVFFVSIVCLSCHVVCWISYLHCISVCSLWVLSTLTMNTQRYSVSMKSNTQYDKINKQYSQRIHRDTV